MKRFLVFILLVSFVSLGRAQADTNNYKHSVGLHAGLASAYGFSYRFWPNTIGVQVTGIPIFSTNRVVTSAGLSLLLRINDFSKIRLYSYFGNHYRYERYSYDDPSYIVDQKEFSYYSAIGVGIRVNFLQVLDFNLQAGYGVGFNRYISPYNPNPSFNYNTTLDGGAGLYFHF